MSHGCSPSWRISAAAGEDDHACDRPEEQNRVPGRARRLLQRAPEDSGEEADEEDLVGKVNQLECSHLVRAAFLAPL